MFHPHRTFQVRVVEPEQLGQAIKASQHHLNAGVLAGNQLWLNDSLTADAKQHQEFAVFDFHSGLAQSLEMHGSLTTMATQVDSVTITSIGARQINELYQDIIDGPPVFQSSEQIMLELQQD